MKGLGSCGERVWGIGRLVFVVGSGVFSCLLAGLPAKVMSEYRAQYRASAIKNIGQIKVKYRADKGQI